MDVILNHVWEGLVVLSGTLIMYIFQRIMNYLTENKADGYLEYVEDVAEIAVKKFQPLAVKYKKAAEDGKLTLEERKELHEKAKVKIYEMLPAIKKYFLEKVFTKDQISEFISSSIVKYVNKNK